MGTPIGRVMVPDCSDVGEMWVLRHGESVHNCLKEANQPWENERDPHLTSKGRCDAEECWLPSCSLVVTSPLRRTLQTAVIVARRLGASVIAHPGLQEAHNT